MSKKTKESKQNIQILLFLLIRKYKAQNDT